MECRDDDSDDWEANSAIVENFSKSLPTHGIFIEMASEVSRFGGALRSVHAFCSSHSSIAGVVTPLSVTCGASSLIDSRSIRVERTYPARRPCFAVVRTFPFPDDLVFSVSFGRHTLADYVLNLPIHVLGWGTSLSGTPRPSAPWHSLVPRAE